MIEAYEVGVSILMDTNIPGALGGAIASFENLNRVLKTAQKNAQSLNQHMRGAAGSAQNFYDMSVAMSRMKKAADGLDTALTSAAAKADGLTTSSNAVADNFERAARAAKLMVLLPPMPRAPGGYRQMPVTGGMGIPPAPVAGRGEQYGPPAQLRLGYDPNAGQITVPGPTGHFHVVSPNVPVIAGPRMDHSDATAMPHGFYMPGGPTIPPSGAGGPQSATARSGALMVVPQPPHGPIPLNYTPPPSAAAAGPRQVPTGAAAGAGMMASVLGAGLHAIFDPTFDVSAIESRMLQAGFTPQQVKAALAASFAAQRNVAGATVPGAMEAQLDIGSLLSNPDAAAKMVSSLSSLGVILNQQGKGGQENDIFSAVQAGELHGALVGANGQLDPAKLTNFLNEVQAVSVATGGRVGPDEILAYMKAAGVVGRVMDDPSLLSGVVTTIISMGASRAGTAAQGFYQQFGVGRMSTATFNQMVAMHLVDDPKKAIPAGPGQRRLLPGGLAGQSYIDSGDIMGYLNNVLRPAIHAYDLKTYGTDNADLQAKTADSLASRIPAGKFIADLINLDALTQKYKFGIAAAQQRDVAGIAQTTNPNVTASGATAAVQGAAIAAGTAALPMITDQLKSFTSAMNGLEQVLIKYPDLGKGLVVGAEALTALATALAGFVGTAAAIRGVTALTEFVRVTEVFGVELGVIAKPITIAVAAIWAAADALHTLDTVGNRVMDWIFHEKSGTNQKLADAEHDENPLNFNMPSNADLQKIYNGGKLPSGTPSNPTHVIIMNPGAVGNSIKTGLSGGVTLPPSGSTNHDGRYGLPPQGNGPN